MLSDLSLKVEPGQIVGLFGANGAGKTTTLRLLTGLVEPTAGTVALFGQPVRNVLRRVGVILEQPAFYPRLTALENLEFALACASRRLSRPEQLSILERTGLANARGRVGGFSLGMRRRLALAIALSKSPDLLLLDEPTNGLDLDGVELLREIIRELAATGVACLISTHEWDEAERLVDAVVILDRGRVVSNKPLRELVAPGERWLVRCTNGRTAAVLSGLPGVTVINSLAPGEFIVELHQLTTPALTEHMVAAGCTPETVAPYRQPLSEAYRDIVKGGGR